MNYNSMSLEQKKELKAALNNLNKALRENNLILDTGRSELYLSSTTYGSLGLLEDWHSSLSLLDDSNDYIEILSSDKVE